MPIGTGRACRPCSCRSPGPVIRWWSRRSRRCLRSIVGCQRWIFRGFRFASFCCRGWRWIWRWSCRTLVWIARFGCLCAFTRSSDGIARRISGFRLLISSPGPILIRNRSGRVSSRKDWRRLRLWKISLSSRCRCHLRRPFANWVRDIMRIRVFSIQEAWLMLWRLSRKSEYVNYRWNFVGLLPIPV